MRRPRRRTSRPEARATDLAVPRCRGSGARHVPADRRREPADRGADARDTPRQQIAIGMLNGVGCGRPGKGNDKGKVEGLVKYTQRTFMTPVPHAASFAALNAALAERCRARQGERAGRQEETIGERLVRDLAALSGIPQGLLEPCEKKPAKVSSTGLVRYRMNDYSVPTRFAFQNVVVKGFVDAVVIVAGAETLP